MFERDMPRGIVGIQRRDCIPVVSNVVGSRTEITTTFERGDVTKATTGMCVVDPAIAVVRLQDFRGEQFSFYGAHPICA